MYNFSLNTGHRSLVVGGEQTLEKTLESLQKYIEYYRNEAGYSDLWYELYEICPVCNGSGKQKIKRKQFFADNCKKCNGSGVMAIIETKNVLCQ